MKKILFLLLCTCAMYGQVSTGQEQEFDSGIKNNSSQTVTAAENLVTQGNDGTYGKITFDNLTNRKAYLSTGLLKNGALVANGDPTKFNITAGIGVISNFDDPENPISTLINFPAFNSITPTYLTTGNITYVAINSTPAVVMQATPFTPVQRRYLILLGAVIHSNLTTINVLNNISAPTNADTNQLHDFMEAVGALNITGNKYTANGANLQLNKSAGVLFKLGSNFAVDWKNPHEISQTGGTSITFRYRTQNGTESADMTSISPALYDLNNVLTTVPNNKFTIQTITVFQTGLTRIQWGQSLYDDLQSAKNALLTRDFVVESNIKENGVTRAYIIVRNSTTSLQNVADAYISEAQKFGGVASGGVALTLANIVTALGYTPENEANKSDSFTVSSSTTYSSTKALVDGLATKQNTLTNPITGTGTTNTIPKWTGTNTLGDGSIRDNVNVSIGTGGFSNKLTLYSAANEYALRVGQNTTNVTGSYTGITFFNSTNTGGTGSSTGTASLKITRMPANLQGNLAFLLGTTQVGMFDDYGHLLIATPTSNGIDGLQTPLTISHAAGTTANQGVIKSQLDLKSDIASPAFTGVPSVPTATTGTNTTQIASTAFVLANVNANAVLLTGNQTKSGKIIFSPNTSGFTNGIRLTNSTSLGSSGNYPLEIISDGTGGSGAFFSNSNGSTSSYFESYNGRAIYIDMLSPSGTGSGITLNSNIGNTGDLLRFTSGKINYLGEITSPKMTVSSLGGGPSRIVSADVNGVLSAASVFTHQGQISVTNSVSANSFIKTGGTSSQFLKADGSIDESDIVKNIVKDATQGANITGTVSETILYSKLIPANTFKDGDFMNIALSRVGKIGVAGTLNQRIRINTSNTLSLSTIIATNFLVSTGLMGNMSRIFNVSNGNIVSVLNNGAFTSDIVNTNTEPKSTLFNPAIDNYIFVTGQLGNSADTMYHLGTKITN